MNKLIHFIFCLFGKHEIYPLSNGEYRCTHCLKKFDVED